ncbi:MAG: hypothetical protein CBARDMAM_1103 [uncultured Caballeronia sp.]|nr:MAG: hypothetical protein CBARDMAM_1103 [uncultured Caballeronia sp.]
MARYMFYCCIYRSYNLLQRARDMQDTRLTGQWLQELKVHMIDVECRTELVLRDAAGREASLSAAVPLLLLVSRPAALRRPRRLRVCPIGTHGVFCAT